MNVYFTSDTHFGHANIVKYCDRPFTSTHGLFVVPDVYYMNRELIRLWNETVGPQDTVFHLGDFSYGSRAIVTETRKKLNGKIVLVRGNHDRSTKAMLDCGFDEVHDELSVTIDGLDIYMQHRPILDAHGAVEADLNLCGHIHQLWKRKGNMVNVGVDVWNYRPITLEEVVTSSEDVV